MALKLDPSLGSVGPSSTNSVSRMKNDALPSPSLSSPALRLTKQIDQSYVHILTIVRLRRDRCLRKIVPISTEISPHVVRLFLSIPRFLFSNITMISFDERTTRLLYERRKPRTRFSCGSDVNAEITVREEVCSSRSPKRSSYYVCFWCLRLLMPRTTISRMKGGSTIRRMYPYSFQRTRDARLFATCGDAANVADKCNELISRRGCEESRENEENPARRMTATHGFRKPPRCLRARGDVSAQQNRALRQTVNDLNSI